MASSDINNNFKQAIALFQSGKLDDAERRFKEVLRDQPKHVAALNLLSVLLTHLKRYTEAEPYIKMALELNSNSDATFYNYGLLLKELKRPNEALERFSQALSINATVAETWNNRGTVFNDLKRYHDAVVDFDKATALQPNYSEAFCNKGKSLAELENFDEALAAYDKALALKPDLTEAWLGRGNVFADLKRHDEAFAAYDKALAFKPDLAEAWGGRGNVLADLKRHDEAIAAYDKALALKPHLAEAWLGRGNVFTDLKRHDDAFAAYDRALALNPDLPGAWGGLGNVFADLKRYDAAFTAYRKALALKPDKPDMADAWSGLGNVFADLKRYDDAFAAYDKALALKPDLAEAWGGRGNLFTDLKRHDDAFAAYDKALALKPDLIGIEGARLHSKMNICDWSNFSTECEHLISSVKNSKTNTAPFAFLAISASPEDQIKYAKLYASKIYPRSDRPFWNGDVYKHNKIRIAYVSPDFHQHPIPYLTAGMFEHHDKTKFEVTAISLGPDDSSEIRRRLMSTFAKFIDVRAFSDDEIASQIRDAEIDVLIDLAGFTFGARTGILARRAAPVQINYLGYASTMGASYIDYLIADATLIPPSQQINYSEKIVYLPNSFMPHDDLQRSVSDRSFDRAEFDLPKGAFVFCCFNNSYKLNPNTFKVWMRILKIVHGSVLWLSDTNATAVVNLQKEAVIAGIEPERLIFAKRLSSSADHLARHRLADLFLDTLPYNAHTTASDALWAGLPVLTKIGETFAGRVAASLLNAVGLPELITETQQEYEELAIELATNPEKLAAIKQKLSQTRLTKPLFNTKLFTRHIEAAYTEMYRRHQAHLPSDHIYVPQQEG